MVENGVKQEVWKELRQKADEAREHRQDDDTVRVVFEVPNKERTAMRIQAKKRNMSLKEYLRYLFTMDKADLIGAPSETGSSEELEKINMKLELQEQRNELMMEQMSEILNLKNTMGQLLETIGRMQRLQEDTKLGEKLMGKLRGLPKADQKGLSLGDIGKIMGMNVDRLVPVLSILLANGELFMDSDGSYEVID